MPHVTFLTLAEGGVMSLPPPVVNLLTNAVRYGNGGIRIDTFKTDGAVTLEIHDDGPGIPKRFEESIWDRFERGIHRFDASIPGSGVGLPIARGLIEAHGGTSAQRPSEYLGGACFAVTLPTTPKPARRGPQHITTPAVAGPAPDTLAPRSPA